MRLISTFLAFALASGCSLLFDPSSLSDAAIDDTDAGISDAGNAAPCPTPAPAWCDVGDCPACDPVAGCVPTLIRTPVGSGTGVISPSAWVGLRQGDLVNRRVFMVNVTGVNPIDGDVVLTGPSGCSLRYVPFRVGGQLPALTDGVLMTADPQSPVTCVLDEVLTANGDPTRAILLVTRIGAGTIEKAELKPQIIPDRVTLVGSNTDETHYMWLASEPGSEHNGVSGGPIIDPNDGTNGDAISVIDAFALIEDITVTDWEGVDPAAGQDSNAAIRVYSFSNAIIRRVILRDDGVTGPDRGDGIVSISQSEVTVDNVVAFNITGAAFRALGQSRITVTNSTAYRCQQSVETGNSCFEAASLATLTARNCVSIHQASPIPSGVDAGGLGADAGVRPREDYESGMFGQGDSVDQSADAFNNLSSDQTAPPEGALFGATAAEEFMTPATGDTRPQVGAQAIGSGVNLCGTDPEAATTIDGRVRPMTAPWNRGPF